MLENPRITDSGVNGYPGRTNSFNIIKRTNFNCDNCTRNMIEKGKGVTEFVNMNAK